MRSKKAFAKLLSNMKTLNLVEMEQVVGGAADGGNAIIHDSGRVLGFIYTVVTNYYHFAPSSSLAIAVGTWKVAW